MGQTPDRKPGVLQVDDEGVDFDPAGAIAPVSNGQMRYVGGQGFRFFEEGVAVGLSGSGLTPATHETTDSLIHDLAETSYAEVVRATDGRVTSYTVYTDVTKVTKVRETILARDASRRVTSITTKQYNGAGAQVQQLVETLTRDSQGRYLSSSFVET